jgi:beta-lactamase regulating signal transducer with metallopeptidase domain
MSALFMKVVNLSITGSWLILAVFLVRYLLKKAPKWTVLLLWALVAVRLILPFSFESAFSLVPKNETIVPSVVNVTRIITAQKPVIDATVQKPAIDNIVQNPAIDAVVEKPPIDTAVIPANDVVRPVIEQRLTPDPVSAATTTPEQSVISYLAVLWIIGIVVMLAYAIISYLRLKKSVEPSIEIRDRILASDDVKSPFILGMLRPRIYVPSSMSGQTLEYVISHEMAHIKRGDHWWKPLGYLLLSVYWFNPLCWLAYLLLCRDIEMACDEKIVRGMDNKSKAAYSEALLSCSMPRRAITACPLAFGEVV